MVKTNSARNYSPFERLVRIVAPSTAAALGLLSLAACGEKGGSIEATPAAASTATAGETPTSDATAEHSPTTAAPLESLPGQISPDAYNSMSPNDQLDYGIRYTVMLDALVKDHDFNTLKNPKDVEMTYAKAFIQGIRPAVLNQIKAKNTDFKDTTIEEIMAGDRIDAEPQQLTDAADMNLSAAEYETAISQDPTLNELLLSSIIDPRLGPAQVAMQSAEKYAETPFKTKAIETSSVIPAGTVVQITNQEFTLNGEGRLQLSQDANGKYAVTLYVANPFENQLSGKPDTLIRIAYINTTLSKDEATQLIQKYSAGK